MIHALIDLSDKTMNFKYKNLAKKITLRNNSKILHQKIRYLSKNPKENDDVFFKPIDIGTIHYQMVMQ